MILTDRFASGPLVKVVDVLGDHRFNHAQVFQPGDPGMRRIGLGLAHEIVKNFTDSRPGLLGMAMKKRDIQTCRVVSGPKPLIAPKGWNTAFNGNPRSGKYHAMR
jgi:hypothetical protein